MTNIIQSISLASLKDAASSHDLKEIANDYPVINGNKASTTWVAMRKSGAADDGYTYYSSDGGKTFFQVNGQDYHGPINFVNCSKITVQNGATLDKGLIINDTTGNIVTTLNIQSGGNIQNSIIYDCYLNIANGGTSSNNQYVSAHVSTATNDTPIVGISGISRNDVFYASGGSITGTAHFSQDSSITAFVVGKGNDQLRLNKTGKMYNANFFGVLSHQTYAINFENGAYYGAESSYSTVSKIDSNNIVITNDYPVIDGTGSKTYKWVAMRKSGSADDGKTYYSSNGGKSFFQVKGKDYSGPINFYNVNLEINNGATANQINLIGDYSNIVIHKGATLSNSSIYHTVVTMDDGAISDHNNYFATSMEKSGAGSFTSENDTFYITTEVNGTLHLSQRSDLTSFPVGYSVQGMEFPAANYINLHVINQDPKYDTSPIKITFDAGVSIVTCYLSGTLIECENGWKKIENLKVGDLIYTYQNNRKILKEIKSIHSGHHVVNSSYADDVAGYPVHIVKNALGDHVPYKDMLITPEHCLFMEGGFIPVRMLVNGQSIYYDHSIPFYDYYHLELEEHSIMIADGVLSETYLDTSNHGHFAQSQNVINIKTGTKTWESDAAAPLITNRETVEPLYHRLEERAEELGCIRKTAIYPITHDPELILITDMGNILYPCTRNKDSYYIFALSYNVKQVYLHSLTSRPSDIIGPYVDDRRELGVLVKNIILFDKSKIYHIQTYLEEKNLSGWHPLENYQCRWTKGHALLPLGKAQGQDTRILVIELLVAGSYIKNRELSFYNKIVA